MTTGRSTWVRSTTLACPPDAAEVVRSVRLEPLSPRHGADAFAVADRSLFTHTMQAPDAWSVRGFEEEFARVAALTDSVAFAIVLAAPACGLPAGHAIGRTTYMEIHDEHRGLEIGRTWIARRFQGTRVNPEAKYLMLRHAFESLDPTAIRVQLKTNATNLQSQRAIAKLGAVKEGVLRKSRVLPPSIDRPEPVVRDWVLFSIVDDEWPSVRASLEERLRAAPALGAEFP